MWPFWKSARQLAREAESVAQHQKHQAEQARLKQVYLAKAEAIKERIRTEGGSVEWSGNYQESEPFYEAPLVRIEIKPEHCDIFYALLDGVTGAAEGNDLAKYRVWLWVETTYPEAKGLAMFLRLESGSTKPVLVETRDPIEYGPVEEWHRRDGSRFMSRQKKPRPPGIYRQRE